MLSLTRRKHAVYIVLTAILSTVSIVIVCTSFATEDWIRATAYPKIESGPLYSDINYGLFKGTLMRRAVSSPYAYDIYFTCIWDKNSCAWSCVDNDVGRKKEVVRLIIGENSTWACIPKRNEATFTKSRLRFVAKEITGGRIFTNARLWLSTVIFIAILTIALFTSLVLSIINCTRSPIETYFNVQGIYITNGIALCANFLTLLLYGICYDLYIKKDISIFDTIVGDYTSDSALGYSYWILMVPLAFEAVGIFLIAMREKIINSDRAEMKIDVATDLPETGAMF